MERYWKAKGRNLAIVSSSSWLGLWCKDAYVCSLCLCTLLNQKKGASLLFQALRVCGLGWKNNQTKKGASLYFCEGKMVHLSDFKHCVFVIFCFILIWVPYLYFIKVHTLIRVCDFMIHTPLIYYIEIIEYKDICDANIGSQIIMQNNLDKIHKMLSSTVTRE